MAVHLPQGLIGWVTVWCGLVIVAVHARGIDAPRSWIEWIERRFAYSMRMRFIGGAQFALAATAWWLLRAETGATIRVARPAIGVIALAGLAMFIAQNPARHLVIAVAEQDDILVRTLAILATLAGVALIVMPFLF